MYIHKNTTIIANGLNISTDTSTDIIKAFLEHIN